MSNRVKKLIGAIDDDEAVIVSGYPNIFYYSGFESDDGMLVISKKAMILITDSRYTVQAKEQAPNFEVLDISSGLDNVIKGLGVNKIGYEEDILSVSGFDKIKGKLDGKEFVKRQKLLSSFRKIKDKSELKIISEAEYIGDMAFSHILNYIKSGMSEKDVELELEHFMKKNGASKVSFETICASGVRSCMPHGVASDKIIEDGDFLTMDFGCVYKGYCSDMTRTVGIGYVSDKQREVYDIVLKAQEKALSAIRVGETCKNVDDVARSYIAKCGYGSNFGHGLGHSVGIEIHEMPSLSPKCDEVIQNGHVLTVEPGIYLDGMFGVRIEDLVCMIDNKMVNFTHSPKELIIL